MSKVTKRKITVESASNKLSSSNTVSNITTNKDSQRRQSVFERLGTKTGASISLNTCIGGQQPSSGESFCRHWSQNGTCPYGKSCVFVNTHVLISPSKRIPKKELEPKQVLSRSLEEGLKLEGLKRLNSTVVKRGSPDLNWEKWDQTDLEYEDEKVLEKRLQLLQRELELQMKQEETEDHHSKKRHSNSKPKKGLSSSSSTSVSSTSSESSSSSDDSSSDSSSASGIARKSKRRSKTKKSKRGSTSSVSDRERKKGRNSSRPMHKDRSPSNINKKSISSRDKRAFTPPKKPAPNTKGAARKKSLSPAHRRHNTPTASSKTKPSSSKSSQGGSRHNQSPRPSKRSTSLERKDKHKRSLSPRPRSKASLKDRSPRRQDRPRRKDSPDTRTRNTSRSRLPDSRNDDRKKDDDRSRNKDDRRQDRKPVSDRDKRDHDDARAREKAREAAREKEREEALERCRERQREREQLAKEKERNRERLREERDKDNSKQRDYDKSIPQLMTLSIHNQADRKLPDRDRDRPNKDRKDREKERDKDKDRDRDRLYDRSRLLDKDRLSDKLSDRDRGNEKDRPRERDNLLNDRNREKNDSDRSFERDRNFIRSTGEAVDRSFDRDKDRSSKGIDRSRDRDFDRDKDRNFERLTDNRRSFEKVGERDKTSLEKDRGIVRDRALDRVLELRERNKSLERGRGSDGERSVDRNRERYDREGRFDRRPLAADEKDYENPYDTRRDRTRYGAEASERASMFKDMSPSREDTRSLRHPQVFTEDRRSRGGRDVRGGWEQRGSYDDAVSSKARDWDYPDSRREWDARNRHGDWEGTAEVDEWGRYGGGGEWGGDWRDDWQHRPPRHTAREDQTIVSSNHIVVRDTNNEDSGGRRTQVLDLAEKDPISSGDFKKDSLDSGKLLGDSGSHKRQREDCEIAIEAKKPRLEDPLPSAILEEALSDISDDPDEILNREDTDVMPQESGGMEDDYHSSAVKSQHELDQRLLEDRHNEDENIDNLDFEEISDEELEEEARANKGLGDALGVDWASLVAESRPRPALAEPGAARRRWQPENIFARIGVSLQYAGEQLYNQIQQQIADKTGEDSDKEKTGLLHPVATLHVALRDRQARRRCIFSGIDTFKRALSARADIAIRRQLCNLPVASLEMQQSSGFCQWVV